MLLVYSQLSPDISLTPRRPAPFKRHCGWRSGSGYTCAGVSSRAAVMVENVILPSPLQSQSFLRGRVRFYNCSRRPWWD